MKINKIKTKGLTLIEALIWFAIFAAVVAGVFALYSKTRNSNMALRANQEISSMYAKLESIYATENSSTLNATIAYQLGVIPPTIKAVSNQTIFKNQFGGNVNITGLPPSGFMVTYTNVPYGDVCSTILSGQRKVGWNYMLDTAGNRIDFDENYNIAKVSTVCKNNGDGSVEFSLYRYVAQ
jgi:type II secretory pathway pseudopilin PulG